MMFTRPHLNALLSSLRGLNLLALRWLARAWRTLQFAAMILSLALTPSSYGRANRLPMVSQIANGTGMNVLWFTVLCALVSLILIRIVVVTAFSYGLSKFALEMVVRVLVLELIPLTAAVFVALRCTLPDGLELADMRSRGDLQQLARAGIDPVQREALPRVMAGIFSVLLLVAVSCVTALFLAYLTIYGFSPWGFTGYTRVVGQVFSPEVSIILIFKTLGFSLAVSIIPMASALYEKAQSGLVPSVAPFVVPMHGRAKAARELASMVRLFSVILLIEILSLMVNYY